MSGPLAADALRVAFYYPPLSRSGPGLMLRDLLAGDGRDVADAIEVISRAQADILVLAGFDYDAGHAAINALLQHSAYQGPAYPFVFSEMPNKGSPSGMDLNGNGELADAGDSLGYGDFSGQKGMAVLSQFPLRVADDGNFTKLLWRNVPNATTPGNYFGRTFEGAISQVLPLSSTVHWNLIVEIPANCDMRLMIHHATTPVFDTAAQENDLRNLEENKLWLRYMRGELGGSPPKDCYVIAADMNGPVDEILTAPELTDPLPTNTVNTLSRADATVVWHLNEGVKTLRADYVLPSPDWLVRATGLIWPQQFSPQDGTNRHTLVWADLARP